jgi:anthranilate phosphoribosyltransferase
MIKEAIDKIVQHGDLTYDEAYQTIQEIMTGKTSPTQNAAFLAALSTKNTRAETIEKLRAAPMPCAKLPPLLNTLAPRRLRL